MSMSKIRRPLLASLFVLGLGVTVASAYDFCGTSACRPASAPVRTYYQPAPVSYNACAPAPRPVVSNSCNPCASVPAPVYTPVSACAPAACPTPSYSSASVYGASSYGNSMYSSVGGGGITYLIPTANGLIESPNIPITNEVDMYYATHRVVNGHVEEVSNLAYAY